MIQIRLVNSNEIEQLRQIALDTFVATYAALNEDKANFNNYLKTAFSTEKITEELADKNSEFYFAEADDIIIGYLKINFGNAQTELQKLNALEIERIYVSKAFQGKKIGQQLFDKAFERSKKLKVEYIWLGVWEKNSKARQFYEKQGFETFGKHTFLLGSDKQVDFMMKLKL